MLKESFRLFHHTHSTPFQKSIIDYYDPKNVSLVCVQSFLLTKIKYTV